MLLQNCTGFYFRCFWPTLIWSSYRYAYCTSWRQSIVQLRLFGPLKGCGQNISAAIPIPFACFILKARCGGIKLKIKAKSLPFLLTHIAYMYCIIYTWYCFSFFKETMAEKLQIICMHSDTGRRKKL